MKNAIVLAGSRGIGKGIADSLSQLNINVTRTSTQDIDTAVPSTVNRFILNNPTTDILVLNTGGPPSQKFEDITREECEKYHDQFHKYLLDGILHRPFHEGLIHKYVRFH